MTIKPRFNLVALVLSLMVSAVAFGQATIFVPADNAVRAQKPNFQILEGGTGGQIFELSIPALGSNLGWTTPNAYCASGQLLGFSDNAGQMSCYTPYTLDIGDTVGSAVNNRIFYADGSGLLAQLPAGTSGQLLQSNGASAPSWVNPPASMAVGSPVVGSSAYNLLVVDASGDLDQIAPGTSGYVLTSNGPGSLPSWAAGGGGGGSITVSDSESINLTLVADDLTAELNLSAAAADAGRINAENSIETDGLQIQVPILAGDSGSGGAAGVAPAPAAGDAAANKFLNADGTWKTAGATFPGTTKGDVYVYNGTTTVRLGVGTNDQVLTADSTTGTGLAWKTQPSPTPYVSTFTGTTLTLTTDPTQKWAYTGASAQTLATFNFSSLPDGATLRIVGRSNTNTLTIPTNLSSVVMNGEIVLKLNTVITFVKDNTTLIEVSRNGI